MSQIIKERIALKEPGKPAISVVVPTMNEADYIQPCIDSLKKQKFPHFEVVAVDFSNDSTPTLCAQAGWRVIKQVSEGVSLARAEGFGAASGKIVACTDADTAVAPGWLEDIAKAFENEKVVCVYGPVYFLDGSWFHKVFGGLLFTIFLRWNRLIGKDHISGMNFAVRKTAYDAIGGFRADLWTAEDVDLGLRIRKLGKVVYDKDIQVFTSVRRLRAEGTFKFLLHHIANYLRMYVTGKASADFKPIR
jgi:glycosyltransferase involved in cell wall biosynthesis